jgi:hydrogenase maturation protein HypF
MPIEEIRIRGTVQGVGFRPTVYHLAKACGLTGEVFNDGQGVIIHASGSQESLEDFIQRLQQQSPPLAKIKEITRKQYHGEKTFNDFVIINSVSSAPKTEITPDAATCPQCQAEIFDPYSRWYRYPFTNCTHCGPRLSIIRAIPYDRSNTSMAAFPMCLDCANLYKDVENRRFHAQPIACHICGPRAWLSRADGKAITASMFSMLDDVDAVCTLLQKGEIVAIKGIGGIHLACDACCETAVQKLRQRKGRYHKPFALMARDMGVIEQYCTPNAKEKELLQSPAAPIVLIQKKVIEHDALGEKEGKKYNRRWTSKDADRIAPSVAPGQNSLGFMLPYTPLHHLILKRMNRPIVLTSGNLSDEPQCIDNDEAREKLGKIADYFLLHNREILNRVDDSVVRVIDNKIRIIRRARGYVPAPIKLPLGFKGVPHILAMGSELKNTFCLLQDNQAILSQHLGDLENASAFQAYRDTINLYLDLFEHKPEAIALDLHPEYLSTKLGNSLALTNNIRKYQIQHHHAHIASCMAENGIPLDSPPVLGIAFDGLGYGDDGTLWGGEFLLADYRQYKRLGTFEPVAMIGGKQAIYQPWRNTYAQLLSAFTWEDLKIKYRNLELIKFLEQQPVKILNQLIEKEINSPKASSVGRLFDAVAAAVGISRKECSYEGQPAIELEALVDTHALTNVEEKQKYHLKIESNDSIYSIDTSLMWQALLDDLQQQISQSIIAAKFHHSLADGVVEMVKILRKESSINQVILTGGVFQNTVLFKLVYQRLQALEIDVISHSLVPPNDGGLSLGQAVIAAAQFMG